MDESNPHIHAFAVPIDDRGRINASFYTGTRAKMIALQDLYAKAMAPFGLQRGERHSKASYKQVAKYYNKLLDAVEARLPDARPGETIEQYQKRLMTFIKP